MTTCDYISDGDCLVSTGDTLTCKKCKYQKNESYKCDDYNNGMTRIKGDCKYLDQFGQCRVSKKSKQIFCESNGMDTCETYKSPRVIEKAVVRTVRCLDNSGYEERFEEGVIYPMEGYVDGELIEVEDMNGETQNVLAERFERVT